MEQAQDEQFENAQAPVTVRAFQPDDAARWDAFVERCPGATFCHRAGWREVIERVFGHRTHFLYAERDGEIRGVLPLGHIKSRLFSNALISTPFGVYGGVAADDEAAADALEQSAADLARELGVDHLELRNRRLRHADWPRKDDLYVTFRKEIAADADANMKAIPRKQRAMVRKGIDAGLEGHVEEDVERLYLAYAESVRNLGTPVFPKAYFQILKEVFGEDCEILIITRGETLIAGVMSFYFRDEVLPYYGGGTEAARAVKGNDFMYWDLMRRAGERGVRLFDFGRSKVDTGSYRFKKHWGFEPEPLHYEYVLVNADEVPNVNPTNPKYRLFVDAWKRLPLPVANWLGPHIVKNLG